MLEADAAPICKASCALVVHCGSGEVCVAGSEDPCFMPWQGVGRSMMEALRFATPLVIVYMLCPVGQVKFVFMALSPRIRSFCVHGDEWANGCWKCSGLQSYLCTCCALQV